jgi:hypothetical protein
MADLRVISTGREFYRIDTGTALLLEEMFPAALERIVRPVAADYASASLAKKNPARWTVGPTASNYFCICFHMADNHGELFFDGEPNKALDHFKRSGLDVPEEIVDEYRRVYQPRVGNSY